MSYQFPPDIADMVKRQIAAGFFDNEDDVLRFALGGMINEDEDVRAVQDAIDLLQAGEEGRPLDEVAAEMRAQFGIPDDL